MQAPLTKNLGSRIHGVESKNQDCLGFPYMDRDQWRIRGRGPGGPFPLFLDQTEVRRAENKFWDRPPLSHGLDDRPPPPFSEGLYQPVETSVARRAC